MRQSNSQLLTVVVMTRDSLSTLKHCLAAISADARGIENGLIEILISDNSTSNETRDYLESSDLGFSYKFHAGILTYDQHLETVFQIAQGEYVKILADDDELLPGFLDRHIHILQNLGGVDVLVSNFVTDAPYSKNHLFLDSEPHEFKGLPFGAAYRKSRWRFGQVSSLTFRRSSWLRNFQASYLGSNYLHQTMYFACSFGGRSWVDASALILCREGSPNFSKSPSQVVQTRFGGLRSITAVRGLIWKRIEFYQSTGRAILEIIRIVIWSKLNTNLNLSELQEIAVASSFPRLRTLLLLVHKLSPSRLLKYLKSLGVK